MRYLVYMAAVFLTAAPTPVSAADSKPSCVRHYTIAQYKSYVRGHYHGGKIRHRHIHQLHQMERCQQNGKPSRDHAVKWRHSYVEKQRQAILDRNMSTALASWYSDGGATASGWHAHYGVAHLSYSFGTKVRFCYHGCVVGIVDDRGPYVGGREWDLNGPLKDAIGCSDLCYVRYRLL